MHADAATGTEYTVDAAHTAVTFEAHRFGLLRQSGRFENVAGHASLDPQSHAAAFDLVIDATSVHAGNSALTAIMRSEKFLDVARFPQILYSGQEAILADGGVTRIEGNLTLHGVTGPLTLIVTGYDCSSPSSPADMRCIISASGSVARSSFGMTSLRMLVADRVELAVRAELVATPR